MLAGGAEKTIVAAMTPKSRFRNTNASARGEPGVAIAEVRRSKPLLEMQYGSCAPRSCSS